MDTSIDQRVRRLEDIEAVRLLMARYHLECDGHDDRGTHRHPKAIADLFTDDGVWGIPQPIGARTPVPAVGRDQIEQLAAELQGVQWIVHFVVNPVVEIETDTARAEFKGIVRMQPDRKAAAGWGLGIYRATARRTASGWRFQSLDWDTLSVSVELPPALDRESSERATTSHPEPPRGQE